MLLALQVCHRKHHVVGNVIRIRLIGSIVIMRSNREASVIVLVPIVIAVLHRRIAVESVVDVWGHIRVTGGQRRKVQHGCKFLTIDAAEEL